MSKAGRKPKRSAADPPSRGFEYFVREIANTLEIGIREARPILRAIIKSMRDAYHRREEIKIRDVGRLHQFWVRPHKRPVQHLVSSGWHHTIITEGYWQQRWHPADAILEALNKDNHVDHDVEP